MCPVHGRESFHGPSVQVRELAVATTFDVSFAFKELVLAIEQQFRQQVKLMFGFLSNFYAQIQMALCDRYFSAGIASSTGRKRLAELYSLHTRDEGYRTVLGDSNDHTLASGTGHGDLEAVQNPRSRETVS